MACVTVENKIINPNTSLNAQLSVDELNETISRAYTSYKKYNKNYMPAFIEQVTKLAHTFLTETYNKYGHTTNTIKIPEIFTIDAKDESKILNEIKTNPIGIAKVNKKAECNALIGAIVLFADQDFFNERPIYLARTIFHEITHFNCVAWFEKFNNQIFAIRFGLGIFDPKTRFESNFFEEAYAYYQSAQFAKYILADKAFEKDADFIKEAIENFVARKIIRDNNYIKFEYGLLCHKDFCTIAKDSNGFHPRFATLYPTLLERVINSCSDSRELIKRIFEARLNLDSTYSDNLKASIDDNFGVGFFNILNSLNRIDDDFQINAIAEFVQRRNKSDI